MNKIVIGLMLSLLLGFFQQSQAQSQLVEHYEQVVAEIIERGDLAVEQYNVQQAQATGQEFSSLYFGVFESSGMEFTLGLKDQTTMLKIESGFSQVMSLSMNAEAKTELNSAWQQLKNNLIFADKNYSTGVGETSFWGKVVQSFLILFREGVEALLVVAALVAYLKRSGHADKANVIWIGVGLALICSVGLAWAFNHIVNVSGAQREFIEGFTMLIAAAVLVYVSFWLFAKREANRWQQFVQGQIDKAISRGSLFTLGFVAFLAVFREGAETLLFYQALMGATSNLNTVWIGMAIAAVALVLVYLLVRYASIRLPIKTFFSATAVLLFAMAFVFVGKGILELQVSGDISTTAINYVPMVSWLGVFPTLETLLGQLIILLLLPIGWFFDKRQMSQT